jgi:hypothetical protein
MQSDWGAGFCANVTVNNPGSSPSTGWTVVIDLEGATVTSSWSANYANNNGVLTVTPLSWNANIPANGSTSVGFCANASGTARPVIISSSVDGGGAGTGGTGAGTGGTAPASSGGTAPSTSGGTAPTSTGGTGPSTNGPATIAAQSDWGAGYCANVTVTNSTTAPATSWTVVIALNGATVTSSWSATLANSGDTLTATPLSWNANIAAGASVGFGYCANGTGRPTIVSATLTGGGATGTGGTGAGTGGTAPASSGGTAPASSGGTPAATGGLPAASGGTSTGGTATGGTATGGAASSCIGETVTTLPTQGTACTTPDQSQCDASGNRCICERGIWYCNNACPGSPPTPNTACSKGAACVYSNGTVGCGCVNSLWMCVGVSSCPATVPTTGDACNALTGVACDYPGSIHLACICGANADAGSGSSWTCFQSAPCPATQPAYDLSTSCTGPAICSYTSAPNHCACTSQGPGGHWVCL